MNLICKLCSHLFLPFGIFIIYFGFKNPNFLQNIYLILSINFIFTLLYISYRYDVLESLCVHMSITLKKYLFKNFLLMYFLSLITVLILYSLGKFIKFIFS
jgi:hypothetical protein